MAILDGKEEEARLKLLRVHRPDGSREKLEIGANIRGKHPPLEFHLSLWLTEITSQLVTNLQTTSF